MASPDDSTRVDAARTILHVDMDAFFASVEVLDRPELAGRPVVVGGSGARGVVASCTYEARCFGVRSAMPSVRARQLCPEAIFVDGHFSRYAEVSADLRRILTTVTPLVEPISIDEAFLDVTGSHRLLGTGEAMGHQLRAQVRSELSLDCSVGVGSSKLVAKLASRAAKPQADRRGVRPGVGVFVVDPGTELDFLHPMPVGALWGVGPATAGRLDELGIRTVGDLAALPEDLLVRQLGRSHGTHLALLARGVDPSPVVANRPTKSLGHEETFSADVHDPDVLAGHALRMAEAVAGQLRRAGLAGRTVSVKVRYADFATVTRSHTLGFVVDTAPALAAMAGALLEALDLRQGVRLLGVSVSGFDEPAPAEQLRFALAAEPPGPSSDRDDGTPPADAAGAATADAAERADVLQSQWRAVSAVLDTIRERYGRSSVGPASGISADGLAVPGPRDRRWGPSAADA